MAEKRTIELEVKESGFDQVTEKTKTLKQQLKEMKQQLGTMDEGSEGFRELVAEAGKLQDKIGDLNQQVKNFASDTGKVDVALGGLTAVTGGFEAVQGAMALAGSENENLQLAMLKVQGAMALANGVQQVQIALQKESAFMKGVDAAKTWLLATATGAYTAVVGTSTGALKVFRLALVSTGIGAIVVLIGLLIANFDKVKNAVIGAYDQFNKLGPAIKTVISIVFPLIGAIFGVIKALEYFGVIDDETTRKNKANAEAKKIALEKQTKALDEQIIAFQKANEKKLKSYTKEDEAMARQIALLKAQGKDTYELERTRIKGSISHQQGLIKTTYLQYQSVKATQAQQKADLLLQIQLLKSQGDSALMQAVVNSLKEDLAKLTEKETKILNENQTAQTALLDSQNNLAILEAEHANDARERAKEKSENAKKEVKEVKDISREIEDAKLKALSEGQEKELKLVGVQYERKKTDLEKQVKEGTLKKKQADELIAQDVIQQGIDEQKIRDKYTQDRIKKEDEDWLKQQAIDLSKQDYEKLLLMQKFDAESLATTDIEKLTTEHVEALKAIDAKYEAEAEAIKEAQRQKQLEATKNYNLIVLSEEELARQAIDQKAVADLEKLTSDFDLKLLTQEQYETAKKALTEKTNKEIAKLDEDAKKKKQELLNSQLDAVKGGLTSIANIAELFAGKSKASQRRAFNIQKASNIASATIDTFVSAQSAYKSVIGVPVVGPVLAPLASAGAIAMGLMNIKKIKESQFEGGAEPSASSGGGGGGGAVQAPQFNVVGNNGMNQLAQLQQKPVQAYVVSSEMTSAQALERNRINNATI